MTSESASLGDLSDLPNGKLRSFPELGSHGIAVCRVAGVLHAIDDNCSHRDARLSEGRLRGPLLTCPLHGAQFDVRDGTHKGPPAVLGIATYRITEDAEGAAIEW